ncbi:MAG: methyltransferase domain-containing protein [Deltaproteobacteria bacterium]|nr:methyltransferase domain-containing protein [Deltaproteobacteria bacterium]
MQTQVAQHGMVEAPVEVDKIRKVYNIFSRIYFLAAPLEKKARMRGIELAKIKPNDRILEVAPGLGDSFLEMLKRVDPANTVSGVDLSPAMLEKTRKRALKNGYSNFDLREGDARHLPFTDETFDVVYSSYMLDLIPLADLSRILGEFHRVLKTDGRLVLVNLSKKDVSPVFYEKIYRWMPYLLGGCRPVLMASFVKHEGFSDVNREFLNLPIPSEIVTAVKLPT